MHLELQESRTCNKRNVYFTWIACTALRYQEVYEVYACSNANWHRSSFHMMLMYQSQHGLLMMLLTEPQPWGVLLMLQEQLSLGGYGMAIGFCARAACCCSRCHCKEGCCGLFGRACKQALSGYPGCLCDCAVFNLVYLTHIAGRALEHLAFAGPFVSPSHKPRGL